MIGVSVVSWLAYPFLFLLSGLLAANNVGSTVATIHGAKVARWRHILFVTILAFSVGGVLFSHITIEHFQSIFNETGGTGTKNDISLALVSLTFSTISWLAIGLAITILLANPFPAALTATASLVLGGRVLGLNTSLTLLFQVLIVQGMAIIVAITISILIYRLLVYLMRKHSEDPLSITLAMLPFLFLAIIPIHISIFSCFLIRRLWPLLLFKWGCLIGLMIFVFVALLTLLWSRLVMVNRTKRHVFDRYPQHVLEYTPSNGNGEERLAERGMVVGRAGPEPSISKESSSSLLNKQRAEESFAYTLIVLTTFSAIVQGAMDVGIVLALSKLLFNNLTVGGEQSSLSITVWIPLLVIIFAVSGILLFGSRMTRKLSHEVADFCPSVALSIELGSYLPVLLSAFYGIPSNPLLCKFPSLLLICYISRRRIIAKPTLMLTVSMIIMPILFVAVSVTGGFIGTFILPN